MRQRVSAAVSNGLLDVSVWFTDRGYEGIGARVLRFRGAMDRWFCRVTGHTTIIYGVARDICLGCLTIVDEHPNGRGRSAP